MLHPRAQQDSILQRNEVPDGLLVGQALAGDLCAFECLVNRYQQQLVGLIQGFLKDHDQSYDILQQVYLQLYLSLPILFRNGSLKGWLQSLPGWAAQEAQEARGVFFHHRARGRRGGTLAARGYPRPRAIAPGNDRE